ncbi:hypothetical protein ASZ90_016069 [hydrocarbon metagenome]|uniref:Uncharacterized protein n=1 Tax=hydrocarbon metagenome TaxID=938273 RepID=A0A0W8F129_9ZZZZ
MPDTCGLSPTPRCRIPAPDQGGNDGNSRCAPVPWAPLNFLIRKRSF